MTRKEMNSNDIRVHWAEVIDGVRVAGDHVVVQRFKKNVAVVVPQDWYERAVAALADGAEEDDPE
ncbi:hypothetical protein ACGFXC_10320 [Streptomyces sp. NPDC048507]|uniref:hypothetical protein n=1 Tax=Streptomyces sp. NPDC048507 TaxID=3365560 RepID=UPI00371EF1F5